MASDHGRNEKAISLNSRVKTKFEPRPLFAKSHVDRQERFVAFIIGLIVGGAAAFIFADLWREPDARIVARRGAFAPQENIAIALFEAARGLVVSITTEERVLDPWSRRAMDVPRGTGSGFVWDDQGHIVTNNHVIASASGARVRLADGRVLDAALVGTAPQHDLAVLRIDTGLDAPRPLPIGESGSLQVGQSVLAIGNPFGLDWTLTTGFVSALDREIPTRGGATIEGLIQTDAAIHPGNSGGPLIDSAGRLIGVNTAIFSPSGSSAGIGFAVPVDTVNSVVPQLISTGTYRPPCWASATVTRSISWPRNRASREFSSLVWSRGPPVLSLGCARPGRPPRATSCRAMLSRP